MNGPIQLKIKQNKIPLYGIRPQPTPINDYINFKKMKKNEILLNLENYQNFTTSELVGGLMELANRDKQ